MIEIKNQVDLVSEAFYILYYMVNEDKLDEKLTGLRSSYMNSLDIYDKKCTCIKKIYNHVKNNLDVNSEDLTYFFKGRSKDWLCYGILALGWNPLRIDMSLEDFTVMIKKQSDRERYKEFLSAVESEEAVSISKDMSCTIDELISKLDHSGLDGDVCFEIIKIYQMQEVYIERVKPLFEKTITLLQQCAEEITYLEEEFIQYWTKIEQETGIVGLLDRQLGVQWEHSKKGTILMNTIMNPSSITISLDDEMDSCKEIIRIGCILDDRLACHGTQISKEELLKVGKVLADKSKLEILELVSNNPAFGKEIASELKLSTATISYHVNQLVELGFLKLELISGKIYYKLDKERVSICCDQIKEYFGSM